MNKDWKEKIRIGNLGKKRTLKQRKNIALGKIGNKNGRGLAGIKKSKEHKEKIRKSLWKGGFASLVIQERIAGRKRPTNCELCGAEGRICFDHDHKTGLFRGWICSRCNVVLGFVKDNKELLLSMVDYLNNIKNI